MTKSDAKKRINEIIKLLDIASEAYYNEDREVMSDFEYDKLYDELSKLENEYDIHLSNSPTNKVGFIVNDKLPKVRHEKPMLSLDKTKSREKLRDWLSNEEGVLSYKLDGLTVVIKYENGILTKGVTRGNGIIGEDITDNVKNFMNVPLKIKYKKDLIIRGEAIIKYSDFNIINEEINADAKYKNPRNLCSGSVRQLDPNITRKRKVYFMAFGLVKKEDDDNENKTYMGQLNFLDDLGFDTVFRKLVDKSNILETIDWYFEDVKTNDNPSDGLVLMYNDIKYGESLGNTNKFPRNAIAFKWQDELVETTLRSIEWSASRTGLINPIAIFDEVEICQTTVKRASLHNISVMEDLKIGIGDKVKVYKANMIIPQIAQDVEKSNNFKIPKFCPVCKSELKIHNENSTKTLHCENKDCPIKHTKLFEHFVSRDCMNIEGISIATIEKFESLGYLKEFADLYKLDRYKKDIIKLEGFGEKSYENLESAINSRRKTELYRVLNSLSIKGIGVANAKLLAKYFKNDFNKLRNAKEEELCEIDFIGPVLAKSICEFFKNKKNQNIIDNLLKVIEIEKTDNQVSNKLENKIFVITGELNEYKNRKELVDVIESMGGKVSNSVSGKTTYLINNDITSNSTKNTTANKLNVPIIDEKTFKEMIK